MKLRFTLASSVAVLVLFSAAMADLLPEQTANNIGDDVAPAHRVHDGMGEAIIQIAAVTQEIAQFASTTAIIGSPIASAGAIVQPAKSAAADSKAASTKVGKGKVAKADPPSPHEKLAAADPKQVLRVVGKSQTGTAAWYGGRYVGRRTSSGERLDTIHPTAAHRTLPLNSLARVTNLDNGRSVIVRVTDRGPVSESLLIDMSPRAAAQLEMKEAGLVPVKVEQVVELPQDAR
jgi:rare lipoprotein A